MFHQSSYNYLYIKSLYAVPPTVFVHITGQRKKYVGKNKVLALRYGNARLDEDLLPDDSCGKF